MPRPKRSSPKPLSAKQTAIHPKGLRIIGGKFRGRSIDYSGFSHTRPMKDDIREAVFNLIGAWIPGRHVFDLFAGTGAIGIEALSRGALAATLIEQHVPSAKLIRDNINRLDPSLPATVVTADSFYWVRQLLKQPLTDEPWAVFCSPPYAYFHQRQADMLEMIASLKTIAPPESVMVVESDQSFDASLLPDPDQWRLRQYSPALIAVWR